MNRNCKTTVSAKASEFTNDNAICGQADGSLRSALNFLCTKKALTEPESALSFERECIEEILSLIEPDCRRFICSKPPQKSRRSKRAEYPSGGFLSDSYDTILAQS